MRFGISRINDSLMLRSYRTYIFVITLRDKSLTDDECHNSKTGVKIKQFPSTQFRCDNLRNVGTTRAITNFCIVCHCLLQRSDILL